MMTDSPSLQARTKRVENDPPVLVDADTIVVDGVRWAVLRSDGAFHLRRTKDYGGDQYGLTAYKAHGTVYRPIHSSMTAEDIEGATYAHDDGTHWHFAHCSPHEQVSLAATVKVFAEAAFEVAITSALIKIHEATNVPVKATAVTKASALVKFAEAVGNAAYKVIVDADLGHWHRNPHHDHNRDVTVLAIDSVLAAWAEAGKTDKALRQDRAAVLAAATGIKAGLETEHTIEWRPARVARLAAEKKAAEAAAEAATETPAETPTESGNGSES